MELCWTIQIVVAEVRHKPVIIDAVGIPPTAVRKQPRKELVFEPEGPCIEDCEVLNQDVDLVLGRLSEIEKGIIANMRLHIRVFAVEDARLILNPEVLRKLSTLGGELDVLLMTL